MIVEICSNMSAKDLNNMVQTSGRIYEICNDIRLRKNEILEDKVASTYIDLLDVGDVSLVKNNVEVTIEERPVTDFDFLNLVWHPNVADKLDYIASTYHQYGYYMITLTIFPYPREIDVDPANVDKWVINIIDGFTKNNNIVKLTPNITASLHVSGRRKGYYIYVATNENIMGLLYNEGFSRHT